MAAAQSTASNNRARTTNDPRFLRGHSGTSSAGRRRRDLVQFYIDAKGGLENITPVALTDIRRAAELVVLAEETRATALREGAAAIDISALVRLEGQAARAVKVLGIKSTSGGPKVPTLQEYLAQRGQKAAETPETAGP